jgi:argininosuccinate lyase
MLDCANANFLTVTELADTLVRETGMSFHQAHQVVSAAVKEQDGTFNVGRIADSVHGVMTRMKSGFAIPPIDVLQRSLDAANFVSVRTIQGGPALLALEPEIERSRKLLSDDSQWLRSRAAAIENAHARVQLAKKELFTKADARI